MASLSYDLIVLGDDFAGLVAATLCASRGMRVLLAEPHKHVANYRLAGETVPIRPLVLSGLQRPGAERVIEELNFDHLMRRRLEPRRPPFQLLGPKLRLEVHPEAERLSHALQRERGETPEWLLASSETQAAFDSLLSEGVGLPGMGFWERREIGKSMPLATEASREWLTADHSEASALVAQLCHLTVSASSGAAPLAMARSVASALQGLPNLAGEAHAWRSLFLEKFQSHSGEHRVMTPQEIETSWGKVTGLRCVDDQVRCDHLIAAMPVQELETLLGAKAAKKLASQGPAPEPIAYRYTLNLIVHLRGLPEGLSDLTASLLDPGVEATAGNFALISTRPAESPGRAIISIEGLAPVDEQGIPDLDAMRDALLAHAQERMPFLKEHIEVVDSPHEAADPSVKRDLVEPIAPRAVWKSPNDSHLDLGVLPYASGIKQLWLANEQTFPDLGLEGQCIAAFSAAKLVSSGASKGKSSTKPSVLSAPEG